MKVTAAERIVVHAPCSNQPISERSVQLEVIRDDGSKEWQALHARVKSATVGVRE